MKVRNRLMVLNPAVAGAASLLVPGSALAVDDQLGVEPPVARDGLSVIQKWNDSIGTSGRWALAPQIQRTGRANVTATWIGPDGGSWSTAANWLGGQVPDGTSAVAIIDPFNVGDLIVLDTNITLSQLNVDDPNLAAFGATNPPPGTPPKLTFAGAAAINVTQFPQDPAGSSYFGVPIGLPSTTSDPARPIDISGTLGLTINGGAVALYNANSFTGTLTVNNARLTNRAGDAGFGNAANTVVLNNSQLWAHGSGATTLTTSRTFMISGSSSIMQGDSTATHTFNGNIAGSGTLTINSNFGGLGVFTANNSFSGVVNFGFGTQTLSGNGAFASASAVNAAGTIILNNSGGVANRIGNSTPVSMTGGAIRLMGGGTEQMGNLNINGGNNVFFYGAGATGTIIVGNVTRTLGGGMVFQAENLGADAAANKFYINNGTSLLVGGLIPFAYGNAGNVNDYSGIENPNTSLVTYGANGVRILDVNSSSDYLTDTFVGATSATNVRLTSDTTNKTYTISAATPVNALVLAPGFDGGGNGVNGIFLAGSGTLQPTSGVILSATSGFDPLGNINSGVGNTISAAVDFGSQQATLQCPGALTITGKLSGSGGLTKVGVRTYFANGTLSDYTGTTTLTGFNRFKGNILSGQVGAYGNSATDIILVSGRAIQNDLQLGATGVPLSFGPDAGATTTVTLSRGLQCYGESGHLIRNFATGTFAVSGPIYSSAEAEVIFQSLGTGTNRFVVSGQLSGPGRFSMAQTQGTLDVTITGNNTFSGGFDLEGTLRIGSDTALGTGTVTVNATDGTGAYRLASIESTGGARTLANPWRISAGTFTIAGASAMNLTGTIELQGQELVRVTNTATTTFSGPVISGGLFKEGSSTLVLSGNNTFHDVLNVGNGTIAGGMVILRSSSATGSTASGTGVNNGENALALDGGISIGEETLVLRGNGIGNAGSLRNLSGGNTWGGPVFPVSSYINAGTPTVSLQSQSAVIGVDAGTLTIDSTILTQDVGASNGSTIVFLANSIGVTKLGPGRLNVGSDVIISGTASFNGAIVASGSLNIAAGSVQILPATGVGTIAGGKSVVDVAALSIGGGTLTPSARLDLTSNGMVVDYTGASPIADIRNLIKAGYAGGPWTGNGITSSKAATSPNPGEGGKTGLGYAEASAVGKTVFLADPIDSTSVIVMYTYLGDTNLDGQVDITDLGNLATNWQSSGDWIKGDFDYSGYIDITDLGLLATNWQVGVGNPLPSGPSLAEALATLGLPSVSVPEPGMLSVIGLCLTGLSRRRPGRR